MCDSDASKTVNAPVIETCEGTRRDNGGSAI